MQSKSAVLWTGGKDCNLALHNAKQGGHNIASLVTFMMGDGNFKAHSLDVMKLQAEALGIPHLRIPVDEPYKESYEDAISKLKEEQGIDTLITGDIAEIHGNTNWITERSKPAGLNVLLPLWHLDRIQILQRLFSLNFKVILSCVKEPWFDIDWLGKELNEKTLEAFRAIDNLDLCGEQGEYHTLVLDGPGYKSAISIESFTPCKENEIMYMGELVLSSGK
jgi:diphthine-ammonia ligase